jgi:serine/threonine protein kinase
MFSLMSPETLASSGDPAARDAQQPASHERQVEVPVHPGQVIGGKYQVIDLIGSGGMGQVYSALHLDLGERVALKFLRREALQYPELVQRFSTEARAAARIRSEHVARVFDVGQLPDGVPFIVMEFLEGKDLSDVLIQRGPLSIELAVDYLLQACEALASAHAKGIVHRDIKPENLYLSKSGSGPGVIKVLDFGVSKLSLESAGVAAKREYVRTTLPVGSPAYMSPEQIRECSDVDHRTDIWALGCALFELVTGQMPFDAPTLIQLGAAILEQEPTPLAKALPAAPRELEAIVSRCLSKDPKQRYADVAELARALSPFASERARIYAERCSFLLPRDGEQRGRVPDPRRVHLRGLDPNRTVPAIIRNEPAGSELLVMQSARQKFGWWVGAALVGAALTLAFALGQYSRSSAVANTATRKADVSAQVPAEPTDALLSAVAEAVPAGANDVTALSAKPAPKTARPSAAAPVRAGQYVPAPKPKKTASFGQTAGELDVGY